MKIKYRNLKYILFPTVLFDPGFYNVFEITINTNGGILYTFIIDNKIETLEGTTTIPEDPEYPSDDEYSWNFKDQLEPIDPTDSNKFNNNLASVSSTMKESDIPIIAILILLLINLGLMLRKK